MKLFMSVLFASLSTGCDLVVFDTGDTSTASADDTGTATGSHSSDSGSGSDDTGVPTETGKGVETADTAAIDEIVEVDKDDADAMFILGGYKISGVSNATDIHGDGQAELLFIDLHYDPHEYTYGYVVPGASAMASTASSADTDGMLQMTDDLGEFTAAGTFGPVGDVDGDGLTDLPFPQPTQGAGAFVFSGAGLTTDRFADGVVLTSEADLTIGGDAAADDDPYLILSALCSPSGGGTLQVSTYMGDDTGSTLYLYPLPETGSSLALDDASAMISTSSELDPVGEIDVDGDGVPELLDISAWQVHDSGEPMEIYLFDTPEDGSTTTDLDARAVIQYAAIDIGAYFFAALLPGDMDGDGLDDLMVRHRCYDATGGGTCNGAVVGLTALNSFAGTVDLSTSATWRIVGTEPYSQLGGYAALVPDVDGDGALEVLAYSSWSPTGGDNSDILVLSSTFLAGGVTLETEADRVYDADPDDDLGDPVAAADLDGDDNPELMLSYFYYHYRGGAYIYSW